MNAPALFRHRSRYRIDQLILEPALDDTNVATTGLCVFRIMAVSQSGIVPDVDAIALVLICNLDMYLQPVTLPLLTSVLGGISQHVFQDHVETMCADSATRNRNEKLG